MKFKYLVAFWICIAIQIEDGVPMNFEEALTEGKFEDLTAKTPQVIELEYFGVRATRAFKVDQNGQESPLTEKTLKFVVSENNCQQQDSSSSYLYELSLSIVKLIFSEKDQTSKLNDTQVLVQVEQGPNEVTNFTVNTPRINAEAAKLQPNQHLFRTWPFTKNEDYQWE